MVSDQAKIVDADHYKKKAVKITDANAAEIIKQLMG